MRLVVVTGMSGSGKRTVLKMLEDMGYYCVDNLPVQLFDKFIELTSARDSELTKVALGLDVRADAPMDEVVELISKVRRQGIHFKVLFLEANDQTLLKRYKESRRMHPLSPEGRVEDGIHAEREILSSMKAAADYVIDTSNLLTRELKVEIDNIFVEGNAYNNLIVNVVSFGFKNGIPQDADLVFDVRFLPNPFYVEGLKHKTGLDKEVQDYVMSFEESGKFLDMLEGMLKFLIPNYIKEGKYQLVIAIGCTGGHHRSVTLASHLYERLKEEKTFGISLSHRDVNVNK